MFYLVFEDNYMCKMYFTLQYSSRLNEKNEKLKQMLTMLT